MIETAEMSGLAPEAERADGDGAAGKLRPAQSTRAVVTFPKRSLKVD